MPRRNGQGIDLIADPTRRRIVALIALGEGRPSKIADELCLSWPATSRQLRILTRAGLISVRTGYADRRKRHYFIEPRKLGQIAAWLAGTEVGRAFPRSDGEIPHGVDRASMPKGQPGSRREANQRAIGDALRRAMAEREPRSD